MVRIQITVLLKWNATDPFPLPCAVGRFVVSVSKLFGWSPIFIKEWITLYLFGTATMPLEQQASEINKKDQYPGVAQLIERVAWDHEAVSLSLTTRTIENKNP